MLLKENNDEWLKLRHKAFLYLDKLRESGEVNMFGARPYLMKQFGVSQSEASDILSDWMKSYRA
tara:strand:+ start:719 stop:910 length:192 start_codon:yes stop_codon:yes gene_type:complete